MVYLFIGLVFSVFGYLLYLQNKQIKKLNLLVFLLQLNIKITNENISRIKRMLDRV